MIFGLILVIIGAAFLLQNLGYISGGTWSIIWPAILIVMGIGILLKRKDHGFFWEERFGWEKKEKKKLRKNKLRSTLNINNNQLKNKVKNMKLNLTTIGHWALIVGIILAIIAGFVAIPFLLIVFFVLGLIVGFLNIKEKEGAPFLVAVIVLLLIGVAGLQLEGLTLVVVSILNNFIAFVAAAGLVLAIKQVITIVKPTS